MAKKKQHLVFVLDKSGSMASCRNDVIGGFNVYIENMVKTAENENLAVDVSMTQFNTNSDITYISKPLNQVEPLSDHSFVPAGGTALLDAVGDTIIAVSDRLTGKKPKVLFVVFTDGEENSSRKYSKEKIKELIESKEKRGWTFVYMGANHDAWSVANYLGFNANNVVNYNSHNSAGAFDAVTVSTMSYMTSDTKENFFGAACADSLSENYGITPAKDDKVKSA